MKYNDKTKYIQNPENGIVAMTLLWDSCAC